MQRTMRDPMRTAPGMESPEAVAALDAAMLERLRFVVDKLFTRQHHGRSVRLPKLLESGDVIVYILGQV